MISITVVDDDFQILARFSKLLERYYGTGNYLYQEYTNGLEFVENLSEGIPNILFMDIEMQVMDGEAAVRKLRAQDINESTFVIYVSSHTERLVPFFALHPFDFLVKPFSDRAVFEVLDKVKERMEAKKKTLTLIIERKEICIPIQDIMWLQSQAHRIEVKTCTREAPFYSYGKLNDLYQQLEGLCDDFLRIHFSFVVNRHYITRFTQSDVYIKNQVFSISSKYKADVIMKLHERL